MPTLIIDNGSPFLEKLKNLIPGQKIVKRFDELSAQEADKFEKIVLSGGSFFPILSNEKRLIKEIELIKIRQKPLLGICYGAQLIAHTFGAKLSLLSEKHEGQTIIRAVGNNPILDEAKELVVYELHRFAILDLPKELLPVAVSPHGLEIFRHREKPIWGLQFHPENLPEKTSGDEIFQNIWQKL